MTLRALPSLSTAALALLVLLTGCGGSQVTAAGAGGQRPLEESVNSPRSGDPTAHDPAPGLTPTAGSTSVNLSGNTGSPPVKDPEAASSTGTSAGTFASGDETADPKKIGARHVLIQWLGSDRAGKSVLRTKEQALVLAQEVLKRARAGEDVGRLANEYSDEPNAGSRGGSLGRFTKGQMVPQFDQVAFKLRVGQISDIVETPFGYHIIQRTE